MSSVDGFLLLSDNLQLKPFAEQYQVMAMTWEMIKTWQTDAQMYHSESASVMMKYSTSKIWYRLWTNPVIKIKKIHPDKQVPKVYHKKYKGKKSRADYVNICWITLLVLKWSIMLS